MNNRDKRVLVGMSGGIDSSATCIMLQERTPRHGSGSIPARRARLLRSLRSSANSPCATPGATPRRRCCPRRDVSTCSASRRSTRCRAVAHAAWHGSWSALPPKVRTSSASRPSRSTTSRGTTSARAGCAATTSTLRP